MEIHGGNIYDKQINLDYSISINPFGLPEKVRREAIRGVELSEHYPDVNCTRLLDEMEAAFLQPRERLIIGNGESELIYAAACAAKPKKALILGPTFVEYERALRQQDVHLSTILQKKKLILLSRMKFWIF